MYETEHPQVPVAWGGRHAEVDEGLAPLILERWRAGIDTLNSCQEDRPGVAWVNFFGTADAKRFLDLVAVYPTGEQCRTVDGRAYVGDVPFAETLYGRITGLGSAGDWEYALHLIDLAVEVELVGDAVEVSCTGPADFEFDVSVRFPRADLPALLERLRRHNAGCRPG
jgi:hypothetical protein